MLGTPSMSRVEEIEAAIELLPDEKFRRIADWLVERDQARWTAQMDADSAAGKLDFLFEEADSEERSGALHQWPSSQ